jgi:transposase
MISPAAVTPASSANIVAWVGIDWADRKHAVSLQITGSSEVESFVVEQNPEALQGWVRDLHRRFPSGRIAIALEQSRGSLFYALLSYDFLLLYPVAPHALAAYRKALYPSGGKDDPVDAALILDFLVKHRDRLRPWKPDDASTRQLALLIEHRRQLVDDRTAWTNRLTAALKIYFPQALEYLCDLSVPWTWAFLARWSSLAALQSAPRRSLDAFFRTHTRRSPQQRQALWEQIRMAQPLTSDLAILESYQLVVQALVAQLQALAPALRRFETEIDRLFAAHPDQPIFQSLPGAGAVLAPRLLAAWGTDRERFRAADQMQCFSGIAPVLERSGKSYWVHWRMACPKFVRQSFHEFAAQSRMHSPWAAAYYRQMCDRGLSHHAAIRALAFKWIRIMYTCWKNRTPYDERRYQQSLQRRHSPLAAALTAMEAHS